jgi:hypothetical protein
MELPTCSPLPNSGSLGVAVFWLRIFLGGVSLGATLYSTVLNTLTASGIWLKAINSVALVIGILLTLCSVLCFASLFPVLVGLELLGTVLDPSHYVVVVLSCACHTLFVILMSFLTRSRADLYARPTNVLKIKHSRLPLRKFPLSIRGFSSLSGHIGEGRKVPCLS